jgi:hypothetical protein
LYRRRKSLNVATVNAPTGAQASCPPFSFVPPPEIVQRRNGQRPDWSAGILPAMNAQRSKSLRGEMVQICDFATRFEIIYSLVRTKTIPTNLTISNVYTIYEISYLKCFVLWERFLEETFLRYVCGYTNSIGPEMPKAGTTFCRTLDDAKLRVSGGWDFYFGIILQKY